jgi:hypothetical protein
LLDTELMRMLSIYWRRESVNRKVPQGLKLFNNLGFP